MPAKLMREIDTLRDLIGREWKGTDMHSLSPSERDALRERVRDCATELWELMKRLDEARNAQGT